MKIIPQTKTVYTKILGYWIYEKTKGGWKCKNPGSLSIWPEDQFKELVQEGRIKIVTKQEYEANM